MHLTYNYQQQSEQGCLAVCLCYLAGLEPTRGREATILTKGFFEQKESYPLGLCQVFVAKYLPNQQIRLIIGNRYYKNYLSGLNRQKRLKVTYEPINEAFLHKVQLPCIVLVDYHVLGSYVHASHYVLLIERRGSLVRVFDPWFGTTRLRQVKTIAKASDMLQKHLKIAKIIIQIEI